MCRQNSCAPLSAEEAVAVEESLLVYCKPVELYNILRSRAQHNPSFLPRCLHYKIKARHTRRLRAGTVIFNYKDCNNVSRETEVTEDFSCPFCLMHCASFKGLRCHLLSSHDLFNFDFWVTEEYQAVNISVNIDTLSETIAEKSVPQLQPLFFCSRPRKRQPKNLDQKHVNVQFLELDSSRLASEGTLMALNNTGEQSLKSFPSDKNMENGTHGQDNFGPDCLHSVEYTENALGITIPMAQPCLELDSVKPPSGSDLCLSSKTKKTTTERSDPKNRLLLQKRQFYHSHRVQPMALEQVLSDRDSEDEVDDEIADLEDKRMLEDFVDVSSGEKRLMQLWNSFVRKQRVLADGHIPWACEAFSKVHGMELLSSQSLFWCWRLFMVKLWNHGLLDASTMNNCNIILEGFRDKAPVPMGTRLLSTVTTISHEELEFPANLRPPRSLF